MFNKLFDGSFMPHGHACLAAGLAIFARNRRLIDLYKPIYIHYVTYSI